MRLTTVSVGVPVFTVRAAVQHSIVRKPTVFERMVLRLSRRGPENEVVGGSTLRQAFEDQLCVQGVPQLLDAAVSGLVRMRVLTALGSPGGSLLDEPIRSLRLTSEGEDFYNRNTLPSSPTSDAVDYWYTPWSNALSSVRPGRLTAVAPPLAFDDALLRPRDPSSLVRRELEENRPRFLKKESRIIDVDAQTLESVEWLTMEIEIHASPEGYLGLKTQGKLHESWLLGLEPAVVQETFLDSAVGTTSTPELLLDREVLGQAKRLTLSAAPSTLESPLVTLSRSGRADFTITLRSVDTIPQRGQDAAGRDAVSCPMPGTLPSHLAAVTVAREHAASCRLNGSIAVTWAGGLRYIPVQAELSEENADRYWTAFSDDLASTLAASPDSGIATVPLLWGSDRPMSALSQRLTTLSLAPTLEMLGDFLTSASELGVTFSAVEADRLAGVIAEHIGGASDAPMLDVSLVEEWLTFFKGSLGPATPRPEVTMALLGKATPPTSAVEVRQLLAIEGNPHLIPPGLLGPSVLAAVLEEVWNDPQQELLTGDVDGLIALEAFRSAQASLDAVLGRRNADLDATGRRIGAIKSVGEALRVVEEWLAAVDDPKLSQATGDSFPSGLVSFRSRVRDWRDAAKANLAPAIGPDRVALIFDSNTLVTHPDALRDLASSQVGVIPNRVLQELDGLKRSSDERTAQGARAAHRTIDALRDGDTLLFESARTDLIPLDFGSPDDADNQILSVAVAFSADSVTLVTSDKNLRAKATSCSIEAGGWPSLQKSGGKSR